MGEEEQINGQGEEPACDFCGQSRALVYCRADAARLCLSCDRHVHRANSVSSKHPRALLCNACSSAPSSIFCSAHGQVLCSNCDFEAHDLSAQPHGRRPVEAFSGSPAAAELLSVLGVGLNGEFLKKDDGEDADDGGWVWDTPRVVRLDDLIVPSSTAASHGFQAMGVPPLPKNRDLACGENKQEILKQLRELNTSESPLDVEPAAEFQSLPPLSDDQRGSLSVDATFANLQAGELQWNCNDWHEATDPIIFPYDQPASFPGAGDGDHGSQAVAECLSPSTPKIPLEILCPDRSSVLSRYKEKRKARRYDKLIRYETRKARADSRVRIKGRFAKVSREPHH